MNLYEEYIDFVLIINNKMNVAKWQYLLKHIKKRQKTYLVTWFDHGSSTHIACLRNE